METGEETVDDRSASVPVSSSADPVREIPSHAAFPDMRPCPLSA